MWNQYPKHVTWFPLLGRMIAGKSKHKIGLNQKDLIIKSEQDACALYDYQIISSSNLLISSFSAVATNRSFEHKNKILQNRTKP